jgi:PKD repeat protein
MYYRLLAMLLIALVAWPSAATAGRKRRQNDALLQVVTPLKGKRENAVAHPHVNVLVVLGAGFDDIEADPATFRAKLGREDITDLFEPLAPGEIPGTTGFRARLDPIRLKIDKGKNKLKVQVRSVPFPRGRRTKTFRDKDKVKFRAESGPNQAPTAFAAADSDLIIHGIPIQFDGSGSLDPDQDGLEFLWDFGDGTTSDEPRPVHTYEALGPGDVTVTLTVTDGVESAVDEVLLSARPPVDPDRTEGLLDVGASAALEFGVVELGGDATRTFTVRNVDATATSQLKVVIDTTNPAFTIDPTTLDLGPSESADVSVTFAPGAEGHADARISLVASAAAPSAVSMIAHGYAGTGNGTGPTMAANPLYFKSFDSGTLADLFTGVFPDGRRVSIDEGIGGCNTPGSGIGDACFEDADCAVHGGTCGGTCEGGSNDGQACVLTTECPGGNCFPAISLFAEDLCGDGDGNLLVLSDDGTFTDPNQNALTERSVTLLRISFDAQGNVQERKILRRLNGETLDIACDGAGGGNVYTPEYFDVDDDVCFRIEKQVLTQIRKTNGVASVVLPRLDAVQGIDNCDDLEDNADAIAVSRNGQTIFANFLDGGIWRAVPSPRAFLTNVFDSEIVEIHPDGSVLYAVASNLGTVGLINLYKVTATQVATGPVSINAIQPCASIEVPTNGGGLFVTGMAAGGAQGNAQDGVAYVAFRALGGAANDVLDPPLFIRGTAAFTSPEDQASCAPVGLIALESFELVSF